VVPLQTQEIEVFSGTPGDEYFRGEYTWRAGQSVTLSWYAFANQLDPTQSATFPNAIPAGLAPLSVDLWCPGVQVTNSGTESGSRGVRLQTTGAVFLQANPNALTAWRSQGTVSWVIGSAGTVGPD
jgi:hypothetical protein